MSARRKRAGAATTAELPLVAPAPAKPVAPAPAKPVAPAPAPVAVVHHGDCRTVLAGMPENSVHAVVTDPPYGLSAEPDIAEVLTHWLAGGDYEHGSSGFMQAEWDSFVPGPATWREVLRVLRPGGHLLCFASARTVDLMGISLRLAGFEIRDCIRNEQGQEVAWPGWVYGCAPALGQNISKAIDRERDDRASVLRVTTFMADAAERIGVSRADIDRRMGTSDMGGWWLSRLVHRCQCPRWNQWIQLKTLLSLSDEMDAEVWRLNGRKGQPGDAWKEREVVGTKPGYDGSGFGNVGHGLTNGTIDITAPATDAARQWDGWFSRIKPAWEPILCARKPLSESTIAANVVRWGCGGLNVDATRVGTESTRHPFGNQDTTREAGYGLRGGGNGGSDAGRFTSNCVHDGSPPVLAAFAAAGERTTNPGTMRSDHAGKSGRTYDLPRGVGTVLSQGNTGTAARYFHSYGDPDPARFHFSGKARAADRVFQCLGCGARSMGKPPCGCGAGVRSHPTVKPPELCRYLARLVTPTGGVLLDPFAGTGTVGVACQAEGFAAVLIELDPVFAEDARFRLAQATGARQRRSSRPRKQRECAA